MNRLCSAALLCTAALLAAPAAAIPVFYTATLSGAAESPSNTSPGTGFAQVTIDDTMMRVEAEFSDLLGLVTVAHIHCCTAVPFDGTAGVATTTPTFTGFPAGVGSGSYDRTFDMSLGSSWNAAYVTSHGSIESAFTALLAGLDGGLAYFNVHSDSFAGGEIRGFLQRVPEPASWALAALGLLALGATSRQRRA